ncbi:hypothetical protein [Agrobacterium tumefaciens]|uniref:Uncharacterized protein n=1 Tax=Agrobacterium tumefaciens TaxID=358 RepID=A0AA44F994_AGRTU|nr:hypothetical protein [Agrobacterium tumefaciens]NTB86849.1 hypothetical protein [Agrobacterium tumefaciens]NTC21178.1 hypothetical protein [Agrobacterium tumefaciens]NTC30726.1 hypothetical protein [Agrobacterium tumefaciens]
MRIFNMFETIASFFSWLINTHFAAGAAGALVRYSTTPHRSTMETIVGGIAGALTASYATPVVTNVLDIADGSNQSLGIAFVFGLIGLYLAEALVRIAQKYSKNPVIPTTLTPGGILDAYQESISEQNNNKKTTEDESGKPAPYG